MTLIFIFQLFSGEVNQERPLIWQEMELFKYLSVKILSLRDWRDLSLIVIGGLSDIVIKKYKNCHLENIEIVIE